MYLSYRSQGFILIRVQTYTPIVIRLLMPIFVFIGGMRITKLCYECMCEVYREVTDILHLAFLNHHNYI